MNKFGFVAICCILMIVGVFVVGCDSGKLNSRNYRQVTPDFEFKDMNALASAPDYYNAFCSNEMADIYCIYSGYKQLGQRSEIKRKYLGKIIKVPFFVWSYSNTSSGAKLSDRGYISEYQSSSEASYCHLVDSENIKKFVQETGNRRGDYDVIGVLSDIDSSSGMLVLDPCFYLGKK